LAKKKGTTKISSKSLQKKEKPKTTTKSLQKKEKPKTSSKSLLMIISIIVIVCVVGVLWIVLISETVTARAELIIDSGTEVQIKHSGGSWISAESGMELYESDSIKTGEDSTASIILFKSSIIRLASNTEVTLKEIIKEAETSVKIEQEAGRTWNTVQKMSGIDNYEVETPTTVASVRGTSFDVYILADGNITITVVNGTVKVTTFDENGDVVSEIDVPEYLYVTIDPNKLAEVLDLKPYEIDDWILDNIQKDEEFRENLRQELYNRIGPFIAEIKEKYGVKDEEVEALVDGYLSGKFVIPSDAPDWAKKLFEFS
jgi:cytoskeletal protein RodZ